MLANGDVVVPLTVCGEPAVVRSSDEGKTWKGIATGGRSLGLEDVLARREGLVLAITDHVWSENLAVDDHDNLFFAYLRDGVHLMVSRDGGRSWRQLGRRDAAGHRPRHRRVGDGARQRRGRAHLLRDARQGRRARRAAA